MDAGMLRDRVTFAQLQSGDDGYGNEQTTFADQFTVAARIQYLRGGEDVMAARLDGRQPVVITVRRSSETEQVKTDWRIVDARDGTRIFNVRSIVPAERKDYFDLLCEIGVAA